MNLVLILLLIVVALILGATIAVKIAKRGRSTAAQQRVMRAQEGEARAPAVLARHGYTVVEEQARKHSSILVDGEEKTFSLRADFLVEDKMGRRFVCDVKTGKQAPKPTNASTRRQLLEYVLIYDVVGVLLVDMEQETVIRIQFPEHRKGAR